MADADESAPPWFAEFVWGDGGQDCVECGAWVRGEVCREEVEDVAGEVVPVNCNMVW